MAAARRARVIVAYATIKVLDPATGKPTVHGFYQGAVLPANADPDDVANLVRREYLEWVDDGEPVDDEAEPELSPDGAGTGTPPATETPRPAVSAPKPEWVAYAVAQRPEGMSEEDARSAADAMTKADLVTKYGD